MDRHSRVAGHFAAKTDELIAERADELVELLCALVRIETISVDLSPGSERTENDEALAQALIADRLVAAGAEVDQWEPDPADFAGHPMMPPWHHWRGRPITAGVVRGRCGGRTLMINGHIDVVEAGEQGRWTSPPFAADVRDGRIYGRGACDMKGGIAAALFALEALRASGVELAGDVVFEAVTDEETCAMGTIAAIHRGYRGDAASSPSRPGSTCGSRRGGCSTVPLRCPDALRTRR